MKARFIHEGKAIDYTPASDVAAGDVIVQGLLVGIALRDMATGQLGALQVAGVFDIAKASGDGGITAGAKVYWNATDSVATTDEDDGGDPAVAYPYLGKAVESAGDTACYRKSKARTVIDLLKTGLAWLQQQRKQFMSSPVIYKTDRGAGMETFDIQATFGKTEYEVADGYGATINASVIDFLVTAEDLGFEPEAGDIIAANSRKYEVMNLGGESCWRWSDPYRMTMRIYTKDTGDEDV